MGKAFSLVVICVLFTLLGYFIGHIQGGHNMRDECIKRLEAAGNTIRETKAEPGREDDHALKIVGTLLTKELFDQGYLAKVDCLQFTSVLGPICKVSLQPKAGGVTANLTYAAKTDLTWQSY